MKIKENANKIKRTHQTSSTLNHYQFSISIAWGSKKLVNFGKLLKPDYYYGGFTKRSG
jgi:hypothetical protein